jgi:hypothetical protein
MLEVSVCVIIRRSLDEVQAQFADVAYHERNGHHRGVCFHVLSGSITFDVVADGPDGAEVTATLCSTRPGLTQLAAPLLRRSLARALTRSLQEDRDDLESGRYASRLGAT